MKVKGFVDLWVKSLNRQALNILVKLGFSAIASDSIDEKVMKTSEGIIIVRKEVIEARDKAYLRRKLNGIKSRSVIVSVKPLNIDAARFAARDKRVDTIIIDKDTVKYIDKTQINMMKQYSKPLELPFISYLRSNSRIKAMIYRRLNLCVIRDVPLIVSSSSTYWNELIIPSSTTAYISRLLNLDKDKALLYISSYPRELIINNGVVP